MIPNHKYGLKLHIYHFRPVDNVVEFPHLIAYNILSGHSQYKESRQRIIYVVSTLLSAYSSAVHILNRYHCPHTHPLSSIHILIRCAHVGVRALYNSYKAASARILGTDQSFLSLRSNLSAMAQVKGAWTIFLNLNPSDMNSPMMFELAGNKYTFSDADIEGPPIGRPTPLDVRRIVAKNPVAAANFFWTYLKCFILTYLGWDMHNKKKVGRGYLGDVDAYFGKFETGKRGVIHAHAQAMQPSLEAKRLRCHLRNNDFRPVLLEFLEHIMCMYLPQPLHDGHLPDWASAPDGSLLPNADDEHLVLSNKDNGKLYSATTCLPHLLSKGSDRPTPTDIGRAVTRVVHEIQTHTHTPTCDAMKRGTTHYVDITDVILLLYLSSYYMMFTYSVDTTQRKYRKFTCQPLSCHDCYITRI